MPKILLVSFSHHPTLQNYLYLLKENLQEHVEDVYSLGNAEIGTLYSMGEKSFFVSCERTASPTASNVKRYLEERKKIKQIVKSISPDIVIFTSKHIWNVFLVMYLQARKSKIYHVFHDPIGHAGTSVSKGVVLYNKVLAGMLDGIITHSKVSYDKTLEYIKPKCEVIIAPLGEKKWLPILERRVFQKRLLVFGRISTYKGCEFIPELARQLMAKGIECKIVVAGKCMDDVPADFGQQMHMYSNIDYIDNFIDEKDLDEYFNSCDASLILHKSISQSGVIVDAYRHSQPIFCFSVEGMDEFVTSETGYISKAFDIDEMVRNIVAMYSDIDKYREKSKNAYYFGKNKFSEKEMARKIMDFMRVR